MLDEFTFVLSTLVRDLGALQASSLPHSWPQNRPAVRTLFATFGSLFFPRLMPTCLHMGGGIGMMPAYDERMPNFTDGVGNKPEGSVPK